MEVNDAIAFSITIITLVNLTYPIYGIGYYLILKV